MKIRLIRRTHGGEDYWEIDRIENRLFIQEGGLHAPVEFTLVGLFLRTALATLAAA